MTLKSTAQELVSAVGGQDNIISSDVCMTRLRLTLEDPSLVNPEQLRAARRVLGISKRGEHGLEIVFGSFVIDQVYKEFLQIRDEQKQTAGEQASELAASNQVEAPSTPEEHSSTIYSSNPERPSHDPISQHFKKSLSVQAEVLTHLFETVPTWSDEDPEEDDLIDEESTKDSEEDFGSSVLIINGPNLNMLGIREPQHYGTQTYHALVEACREEAAACGFESCRCFQSNHEGEIIDEIHRAYGNFDAIVINPAAYTHTSVALLDALKAVSIPTMEVHLSDIDQREDFRQISYVRAACLGCVSGKGIDGYRECIQKLAEYLQINAD